MNESSPAGAWALSCAGIPWKAISGPSSSLPVGCLVHLGTRHGAGFVCRFMWVCCVCLVWWSQTGERPLRCCASPPKLLRLHRVSREVDSMKKASSSDLNPWTPSAAFWLPPLKVRSCLVEPGIKKCEVSLNKYCIPCRSHVTPGLCFNNNLMVTFVAR